MKIIRNIAELKEKHHKYLQSWFCPDYGFVLHKGHMSLVKKSLKKCNKTLVSIYVNPAQFNNKKDFLKYPRNINKDLKILKKYKIDFAFLPKTKEIYKIEKKKKS